MTRINRIVLSVSLAACSSSTPETPPPAATPSTDGQKSEMSLQNTWWKLTELGGEPAQAAGTSREPHFILTPDDAQLNGNGGCNGFGGSYELSGDSLRFRELTSTLMACIDPELNQQERAFLDALRATRSWRISGDSLELSGEMGPLARFEAQSRESLQ